MRPLRIGEVKKKKKKKKEEETTAAKYNGLPYWVAIISQVAKTGKEAESFLATVSKTVRPMLGYIGPLSFLSFPVVSTRLSVCNVGVLSPNSCKD